MNPLLQSSSAELWQLAGWTMIHFLWLGTLVVLAAWIFRLLLRRRAPNVRYASALFWLAVLAALPIGIVAWLIECSPPFQGGTGGGFADQTHHLTSPEALSIPAAATPRIIELNTPDAAQLTPPAISSTPPTVPLPISESPEEVSLPYALAALDSFVPYLPWLWIIGAPITFALLAAGFIGTKRLRHASRPVVEPAILDALSRVSQAIRITRRVSIAVCDRIAAPVLIGILRPIILLPPAALTGWSPDEIEMVLLHELAHVRRWDNLVNLVQRIVESLLFFHPAVWLVSSWVRQEREACCDAIVVARTHRPHAYAELLVTLAAQMPRSVLFHPAANSAMAAGPLRSRIRRILQLEDDPMLISGKSFLLVVATVLAAATLAVLYLPAIGQAEEKATEAEESTTEITEGTEKKADVPNEKKQLSEDWTADIEFARARDREVALRAWKELGLKLVPATAFEVQQVHPHGWHLGLKLLDFHKLPQLEGPFIVAEIETRSWSRLNIDFESVEEALDAIAADPKIEVIMLKGAAKNSRFTYSKRLPQFAKLNAFSKFPTLGAISEQPEEPAAQARDPENDHESASEEVATELTESNALDAKFPHVVPFEVGSTRFDNGDKIEIREIHGTAPHIEPGNVYLIKGTYKLTSRNSAQLSTSTTSTTQTAEPLFPVSESATRGVKQPRSIFVGRGEGAFELLLIMSYRGWPHVSFYPADGGSSFGGIYFGTGDSVLKIRSKVDSAANSTAAKPDAKATPQSESDLVDEALANDPQWQMLQQQLAFRKMQLAENSIRGRGNRRAPSIEREIAQLERQLDQYRTHRMIAVQQHPKFPSLEEQELADIAYRRLGWELEPISDEDLERVKALGYDGGVRVAHAPQPGGFGSNISYGSIQTGDILVGLHVWPTRNLQEVVEVLNRDDLAELDPLKFYVVRAVPTGEARGLGGGGMGAFGDSTLRDAVVTGRISVNLEPRNNNTERSGLLMGPYSLPQTAQPHVGPSDEATPQLSSPPELVSNPFGEPSRTPESNKSALRYDGKTFDQWQNAWRTELSTEKRLEAVKALAAFGANGYGKEAASAILDVAPQYDWHLINENTPQGDLQSQIVAAFQRIPVKLWLPILIDRANTDHSASLRLLGRMVLKRQRSRPSPDVDINSVLASAGDVNSPARPIAVMALAAVDPNHKNPQISAMWKAMLESDHKDTVIEALSALTSMAATHNLEIDWMPLLLHANEQVRSLARRAADSLDNNNPPRAARLARMLHDIIDDPQRPDDRVAAIRAIAVLGKEAGDSYETLHAIMMNRENPIPLRVAAMKALERIALDGSIENQLRVDFINANADQQNTPEFRKEFNQLEHAIQQETLALP